ncbi:three-helix bundle dimerization domain-containing protein [Rhodococcus koreensis]
MNATTNMPVTEEQHIAAVRRRLAKRFPHVDPHRIDTAVDTALHRFDGRPVRDFVPLLVERAATTSLQGGGSHPIESGDFGIDLR